MLHAILEELKIKATSNSVHPEIRERRNSDIAIYNSALSDMQSKIEED